MFELGTDRMWAKVSRPQLRDDSLDERDRANGPQQRHMENANSDFQSKGRMIDDYYFDKSKRRDSRGEYKAMCPRSPSEEDRMMRIALEASKREREIEAEEEFRLDNIGSRQRQQNGKTSVPPSKLYSIGEDNLIDFGVDDAAKAVSQINISRQSTDVSVLGDDDATTASFVLDTAWNGNSATGPSPAQQQSGLSPRHLYHHNYNNNKYLTIMILPLTMHTILNLNDRGVVQVQYHQTLPLLEEVDCLHQMLLSLYPRHPH